MPAPRMTIFFAVPLLETLRRLLPFMIPCRSKKNALIMFLLTWPVARLTKYWVSMSSALSTSTCEPSTAAP